MPRKFDFISPGVSLNEVDQSEITLPAEDDGILIIGFAPQGPANVPVKIKSLTDFYTIFGRPISGKGSNATDVWRDGNEQVTTYGMYAAQAWLASEVSPVTFIRLLGEDATNQATGYVKAGWNTNYQASTTAASNASAYGLFLMPSGAHNETSFSGKLAAVIYASGSSLALKGTRPKYGGGGGTVTAASTLIESDASSGIANTFTLSISSSTSAAKELTFHLDRDQKDGYIRNVLNSNPQKLEALNYGSTESYFLGETFEVAADDISTISSSAGQQYGILMPLAAGATRKWSDHEREATASKTGYFINRNPNATGGFSSFNIGESEAQAAGSVTITGHIVADETVTIISTDGTSKAYVAKAAEDLTADPPEFNRTGGGGSVADVAASLARCIHAATGHNGKIIVEDLGNGTLNLTQATAGTAGNRTIADGLGNGTVVNFTGGADLSLSAASKLFRLVSLHEGEWFQRNYGVRIANLRLGTTASPNSSFSVIIVNKKGDEVERFDNLNLNEGSANFVAKRIGDQSQSYNSTLGKYVVSGEYLNNSDYVRVEMHSSFRGISDSRALPFGVYGPRKGRNIVFSSGSLAAAGENLGLSAKAASVDQGHAESATAVFADLQINAKLTLQFPELKLTSNNTSVGNYGQANAHGVRHMRASDNEGKKTLWDSPDYIDIVRALPGGLDITGDASSDYLKQSWIFSLDELRRDSTDPDKYYYELDSHKNGNSVTAGEGTNALLSSSIKQFNAAFFGGADGLDIRQVDPFSSTTGLAGSSESAHYAYNTVKRALDIINDPDLLNFDILAMPGLINNSLALDLIRVAEERGDALAIVDLDSGYKKPYENNGTEVIGDHKQAITYAQGRDYDTSYAAAYYPPVRLRDTAGGNDDVTVAYPSVAAIGAIGSSESNSDGPWFAPAGFNRGGIKVLGGNNGPRVVGTLEHLTKQNRDDLYEENINPIARFPAVGEIVIFGQKTLQQTPSALDRINVRRLMIYLKKEIGRIADTILFDQNVNNTFNRFKSQADAVLADVRSRFGITEYKLVLDETTTTADLVDRNIMYAKVFVKPARAIEFIVIDFVITKTGIEL